MASRFPVLVACSVASFSAVVAAQAPVVASTAPAANRSMGAFDPIRITFAAPLAPASITPTSVRVFGSYTGAVPGTVTLSTGGTTVEFQPSKPLLLGDRVHVTLANTITAAGGAPLVGGFHLQVWVASAPGSGQFQQTQTYPFRQLGEGHISTYGIHGGDVDRDGTPDMTAINEIAHDLRLYKSSGCGAFSQAEVTSDGWNWPSPQSSADFNRDGWLDLVTGDYLVGNVSVFLNNGAGSYLPPVGLAGGSYIRGIGTGDFNGDGFDDIVVGNGNGALVWLNNTTGGFLAATVAGSVAAAEVNVVDADEDGHLDIVCCDLSPAASHVLLGNGDGTFVQSPSAVAIGGQPFAAAAADLNGDGHVDVGYACLNPDSFRWFLGDGSGNFALAGAVSTAWWPTSVHMADLEGDGDQDVVLSHYGGSSFYVLMNAGNATFAPPLVFPSPAGASCTTIADFDRDGDLDILGADEVVDIGIMFTQVGPSQAGLQGASCDAALRINQRADGAGYGGGPPVQVRVGSNMAVGVSGQPGGLMVVAAGLPLAPGVPVFTWGLLGIDPTVGLIPVATMILDNHGEALQPVALPLGPVGGSVAMQALALAPTVTTLSNPMQCVLVP